MQDFNSIFFIIFFMALLFVIVGFSFIWLKGLKICSKTLKRILFNGNENNTVDNQDNNHTNEENKTKGSIINIIILAGIGIVYYLSQYMFKYYIFPTANVILVVLLTILFCYNSIFCKRQYRRLFLVVLGLAAVKLTIYYYDYIILSYDFYTHANINLIAYYIIKVFTIINLLLFIIRGVQLFLNKTIHKIDRNIDKYESAWYKYIDNVMNYYKTKYTTSEKTEEMIKESGREGEANVRYHLKWLDGYKVLNNVRLPNPIESQEFDHIVIGENGVFHLETKNHGGKHGAKILINKEGDWSIIQNGYSKGMKNPLFQVRRHERVLMEFLDKEFPQINIPIKEIVVLSNENTIIEGQENSPITVLKVERLNDFIINYKPNTTIDEKTIELIYDKLIKYSREETNSRVTE
ncbi:nuclease-related domain-containing protein [Defluviitalea phaphyphila]|nr:nuclease-related domain-containing protein [Defluviitalea phaphyphila]